MGKVLGFVCSRCGEVHPGPSVCLPTRCPTYYLMVPEAERQRRGWLTSDHCVIDDKFFFIYGSLRIPIHGYSDPFTWGVWVSLDKPVFERALDLVDVEVRESEPAYVGWLSSELPLYPPCLKLVCEVHTQPVGYRPLMLLRAADHPLVREQQEGITVERVQEIMEWFLHGRFEDEGSAEPADEVDRAGMRAFEG